MCLQPPFCPRVPQRRPAAGKKCRNAWQSLYIVMARETIRGELKDVGDNRQSRLDA
jgi:hypothetical protein